MIGYHFNINRDSATSILLLIFMLLCTPESSMAVTKRDADMAYRRGDYQHAIASYQNLLKQRKSADIYYNLGNAYYRSDSITMAILAYERASLLSPGDKDIRYNLQFARSKTIDKLTSDSEVVFTTWYRSLVNFTTADIWALISIVSIILAFIHLLVYFFVPQLVWRKVGFFGGVLFILVFASSTLFAWSQHKALAEGKGAIIMAPSVNVKSTPVQNSEDSFILHEGTRVDVTDSSMKTWRGIRLPDGREGWMPASQLEMI